MRAFEKRDNENCASSGIPRRNNKNIGTLRLKLRYNFLYKNMPKFYLSLSYVFENSRSLTLYREPGVEITNSKQVMRGLQFKWIRTRSISYDSIIIRRSYLCVATRRRLAIRYR